MELVNSTPYTVERLVQLDSRGEELLLVIVKVTYDLKSGQPCLHARQEPIHLADTYHGKPDLSSLKYAGDGAICKPATDVILLGSAYAQGPDRSHVDVRLKFGKLAKTVRVFGERHWEKKLLFTRPSAPEAFERVPLVWERSFGGIDASAPGPPEGERRNPVGVGFRSTSSHRPLEGTPLPNLEDPHHVLTSPKDRPAPAGFGFVASHWEPRARRAGTYDAAWLASRAPLLPNDFDPLFYQTAPPDQIYEGYAEPGIPVEVDNASPSGRLAFALPAPPLVVQVKTGDGAIPLTMRTDTVVLDGEAERLILVLRGHLSVHNKVYDIEWIQADCESAR